LVAGGILKHEYVLPDHIFKTGYQWIVEYEPLNSIPVIQGSVVGILHNNCAPASHFICSHDRNGALISKLNEYTGVITAVFDDEPNNEHYLYVNYEAGLKKLIGCRRGFEFNK